MQNGKVVICLCLEEYSTHPRETTVSTGAIISMVFFQCETSPPPSPHSSPPLPSTSPHYSLSPSSSPPTSTSISPPPPFLLFLPLLEK